MKPISIRFASVTFVMVDRKGGFQMLNRRFSVAKDTEIPMYGTYTTGLLVAKILMRDLHRLSYGRKNLRHLCGAECS